MCFFIFADSPDPTAWGPVHFPCTKMLAVGEPFLREVHMYDWNRFTDERLLEKIKEQENWIKSENITNPHDGFQKTCQDIITAIKEELSKRGLVCVK